MSVGAISDVQALAAVVCFDVLWYDRAVSTATQEQNNTIISLVII